MTAHTMMEAFKVLKTLLSSGLEQLHLSMPQPAQDKILAYIDLLIKWNKVYSLTAICEPKEILIRHIFDSLAVATFIVGPNILDFGTGAGLPGIPLALALPEYNFVLLDSVNKKTNFLKHVVLSLDIKNVTIVNSRVEQFQFENGFDTIITRATTDVDMLNKLVKHLQTKFGQILAMRGKCTDLELNKIFQNIIIHKIKVPYLNEERHLWQQKS